jgi:transposase-like protein
MTSDPGGADVLDDATVEELIELICRRSLDARPYPAVHVAVVELPRLSRRAQRRVMLTATGCTASGDPEPLGLAAHKLPAPLWATFLLSLRARGLVGVETVTSPGDADLAEVVDILWPGARWEPVPDDFEPDWLRVDEHAPSGGK